MAGRRGAFVAALLCAVVAGCAAPPAPSLEPATTRRMAAYLDDTVHAHGFRGAVEVRLGEQVLLRRGFDRAGDGEPATPDTRFVIASLTKQFTALAVLILQERGRLRVADPVCDHLPDCPAAWRAITIDQLLTHTSGLFDYMDLGPEEALRFFAEIGGHEPTPAQLTGVFTRRPLLFPPGTRWDYSSSGYVLLGRLVERLTGQDYGRFLRTAILDPLGMADTGYAPGSADGRPGFATGYHDWTTTAQTLDTSVYYAGGGMYSTARDLARWNDFLLTGTPALVDPGTLGQLLRARVETRPGEQYGYGIESRDTPDGPVFFHRGWVAGFASYDEVQPATGVSVVVLSNLDTTDATRIGRSLASMARE